MSIEIAEDAPKPEPTPSEVQAVFETLHEEAHGQAERAATMLREKSGIRYVYNRLAVSFEKFFDGRPYKWESHEAIPLPEDVAKFMYSTSVVSYEPVTGQAVRALVTTDDEKYGIPYVAELGPELISREISDNYTQRGTGGLPTKAKIVAIRGGDYDMGKRIALGSRINP